MDKQILAEWLTWARENYQVGGHLRPIIDVEGCPWGLDSIHDSLAVNWPILSDLESLIVNPDDLAARYLVLSHLWQLAEFQDDFEDEDEFCREQSRAINAQGVADLQEVVRRLPLECCSDWKRTEWELWNCVAARDWGLVRNLIEHAESEKQTEQSKTFLIRAQFELLVAVEREIDLCLNQSAFGEQLREHLGTKKINFALNSHWWLPFDFSESSVALGLLWVWACELKVQPPRNPGLEESVSYFRKALATDPALRRRYAPVLGRMYAALHEFPSAAEHYTHAMRFNSFFDDRRRTDMALCAARCFRWAGNSRQAISTLEAAADLLPNAHGIYVEMAEIYSAEANPKDAARALTLERERNAGFGNDWKDSTIMSLYAVSIGANENVVKIVGKDNVEWLRNLIGSYWTRFSTLEDSAKIAWTAGVGILYFPSALSRSQISTLAVISFAKALEIELKTKVFGLFRKSNALSTIAETAYHSRFLAGDDKQLTLGRMSKIIDDSRSPRDSLSRCFKDWLRKNQSRFFDNPMTSALLKSIAELSASAKHSAFSETDTYGLEKNCKSLIDLINC